MKITLKLKQWLLSEKLVADDQASDEVFLKAATDAITSGTLTAEKLVDLQTEEEDQSAGEAMSLLKEISRGVKANRDDIEALKTGGQSVGGQADGESVEKRGSLKSDGPKLPEGVKGGMSTDDGKAEDSASVRVKSIKERYSDSKTVLRYPAKTAHGGNHPKANMPVQEGKRVIHEETPMERAICGMWFKQMLNSSTGGRGIPTQLRLNDEDNAILDYALHECEWGGKLQSTSEDNGVEVDGKRLTALQQKQVVDDLTSGGLEIAPIAFDDAIIRFPLLFGELFPKVREVPVTRGRRMEGASILTVTMTWGGGDDTNITLQATAGFIAAFDTLIHVIDGAIEIGLDFLSDASVDIGPIITEDYGRRLMNELDAVIATGTGTGRPTGVMVAAGTTAVASANGAGGPPTVGDYEGLLFGVPKEYKQPFGQNDVCYCANETTYSRARGIAVGSDDQRRVFGMDHESYMLFDRPYSIQGSMTNSQIFFGVMPRYRMYRRLGLTMRSSTEGTTLIRRNMLLMTARARFGGQPEDGASFAVQTDSQS